MSAPAAFYQIFQPHLRELARLESTADLEQSPLYRTLLPDFDRILGTVWQDNFAEPETTTHSATRVVAWNIERGNRVDAVTQILAEHPALRNADVLLMSELDWGMARTGNRFVAREIARGLKLNCVFAACYIALTKGAGVEKQAEGENTESLHGNALFSRHPVHRAHSIALPNGKDKMKGAEKRIGSQRAVIADIEHPAGMFRVVSLHLDAHSSQKHRARQMKRVIDHLETVKPDLPTLIGGDWNTTTHNASRAIYSIIGYFRRVLMGVRNVVRNHLPYPDRWFERQLFRDLEKRGYRYRELNGAGDCTLHYNVKDIAANLNMAEWVPKWCFWFIHWALDRTGGKCSMKLDWFAGKGIRALAPASAIHDLTDGGAPVSDHDPIVLSFRL